MYLPLQVSDEGMCLVCALSYRTLAVNKSEALHVASVRRFSELHSFLVEPLASLVHIGHRDPDVSKPSRVLVTRVIRDFSIIFGAPVVGQLHGTGLADANRERLGASMERSGKSARRVT